MRLAAGTDSTRGAVVLGAGVLGLEAARGLAGRGLPVTLIQRGPRLMERQLDAGASRLLTRTVRALGVDVRAGAGVRAVRQAEGTIKSLVLNDRGVLDRGLLVLCCGIRPPGSSPARRARRRRPAFVVDDELRSVTDRASSRSASARSIAGGRTGSWRRAGPRPGQPRRSSPGQQKRELPGPGDRDEAQGGRHRTGQPREATTEDDAADGTLDSAGEVEVIRFIDGARGVSQKLVVREAGDGHPAGANTRTVGGWITQLFDRGATLPDDRAACSWSAGTAPSPWRSRPRRCPGRAVICQCNGVTKSVICAASQTGPAMRLGISARPGP